ncbi:MAG: SIS domain-containing protein [Verrucomicrobiales bacterium]|nr:SIS domain-containing protein [Verrucomicrobiales bacterium]MCP5526587.1 SIS domain-containing protein [Verrucomicrobiales bacterium]
MNDWINDYFAAQKRAVDAIPVAAVARIIGRLTEAWENERQVFVCGNGGSAANASHFATDLGKGASDKLGRRFRVLSLNDNVSWMTALGNDYAYEDVFVGQLQNYARSGDLLLAMSVSGNSPNLLKAVTWAKERKVHTVALIGGKRGRLAEVADEVVVIEDTHYGRVEDCHMHICHVLCYAFMEGAAGVGQPAPV